MFLLSTLFPFGLVLFSVTCEVLKDVRRYVSFSDMLESENLQSILPGVESIDEGNLSIQPLLDHLNNYTTFFILANVLLHRSVYVIFLKFGSNFR